MNKPGNKRFIAHLNHMKQSLKTAYTPVTCNLCYDPTHTYMDYRGSVVNTSQIVDKPWILYTYIAMYIATHQGSSIYDQSQYILIQLAICLQIHHCLFVCLCYSRNCFVNSQNFLLIHQLLFNQVSANCTLFLQT